MSTPAHASKSGGFMRNDQAMPGKDRHRPGKFRFKQFSVSHHRSAMKVGVDGVLVGCWADVRDAKRILDVGTGCGVIALMMAQRAPEAEITGIDIDRDSVEEAVENIVASPWSSRIMISQDSFSAEFCSRSVGEGKFDLIVSNPPYFDSGLANASTPREVARHQGDLSPHTLLSLSCRLLSDGGRLAMVVPLEVADDVEATAAVCGYQLERKCYVRGHANAPWKRMLLQWRHGGETASSAPAIGHLTLEISPGVPTDEYRTLGKDFYLKF